MESLIELVAASFARHGIECRDAGSVTFVPTAGRGSESDAKLSSDHAGLREDAVLITALPDHNYRKTLQGDPAP